MTESKLKGISFEDWMAEIDRVGSESNDSEEFKTSKEWAEFWGVTHKKIMQILQQVHSRGRLVCKKASREGINGGRYTVPVYSVISKRDGSGRRNSDRKKGARKR